jgi:hypothetical protein
MRQNGIEIYSDFLLANNGAATALAKIIGGEVSHDQVTRFLSGQDYTSKELWVLVKPTVRKIETNLICSLLSVATKFCEEPSFCAFCFVSFFGSIPVFNHNARYLCILFLLLSPFPILPPVSFAPLLHPRGIAALIMKRSRRYGEGEQGGGTRPPPRLEPFFWGAEIAEGGERVEKTFVGRRERADKTRMPARPATGQAAAQPTGRCVPEAENLDWQRGRGCASG